MSLRLSCSGAATAPPAAPRACAFCPAHLVRLSAPVVALLLLSARHWQAMGTAGHPVVARHLATDVDLNACELLQLCSPVLRHAERPLMLRNTQSSLCSPLCDCHNDTAAAGQNAGLAAASDATTTASTSEFFGMDFLLVVLGKMSAEVAQGLVRFHAGVMQSMRIELCIHQHLFAGTQPAVGSRSTTSISEFLFMNLFFAIIGKMSAGVSSKLARFEAGLKLYDLLNRKSAHNVVKCACSPTCRVFYYGATIFTVICSFFAVASSYNFFTNKVLLGSMFQKFSMIYGTGLHPCIFSALMLHCLCRCVCYACVRSLSLNLSYKIKELLEHLSYNGWRSSTRGITMLILLNLTSIDAVCATCKGAVDGCAGGAACPWLTTVASNAAAVVITATAGFISAKALLPPGLLQAFPRSALDTILLLARMPAAGTPFNMTSTTTVAELRMAYRQGRISKSDVAEGISTLVSNAGSTSEELTKLQMQIKALELELSEPEPQARTELGGGYVYVLAKVSQFVLKSNAPVWARAIQERTGTSLAASLHFPPAEIADGAVPMMTQLFVLFVHAFGLEHLHTVGPFIHRVVHESVWVNDFTWQYAFELLVVYLKALDERRNTITMGNIWESGSQDTFAKNAQKAATQRWGTKFVFFRTHGGNRGTDAASRAAATAAAAAAATDTAAKGGADLD